ncbi:MAG: hypothetical protein ACRCY4_08145 [Brevinema sp.]
MKGLCLALCLVFAGCMDVTHYISLNENGKVFISFRVEVSKAVLEHTEIDLDTVVPSSKLENTTLEKKSFSTPFSEGRELSGTFPLGTKGSPTTPFMLEDFQDGYRIIFNYPYTREITDSNLTTEMAQLMLSTAKYRFILAKKSLKTTLSRSFMKTTSGEIPLDLLSFEDIYVVDVPLLSIFTEEKMSLILE